MLSPYSISASTQRKIKDAAHALRESDYLAIVVGSSFFSNLPDFRRLIGGTSIDDQQSTQKWWQSHFPHFPCAEVYPSKETSYYPHPKLFIERPHLAWGFWGNLFGLYWQDAVFGRQNDKLCYEFLKQWTRNRLLRSKYEPQDPVPALLFPKRIDWTLLSASWDGHFGNLGYNREHDNNRLQEPEGNIHYLQCSRRCTDDVWPVSFYRGSYFMHGQEYFRNVSQAIEDRHHRQNNFIVEDLQEKRNKQIALDSLCPFLRDCAQQTSYPINTFVLAESHCLNHATSEDDCEDDIFFQNPRESTGQRRATEETAETGSSGTANEPYLPRCINCGEIARPNVKMGNDDEMWVPNRALEQRASFERQLGDFTKIQAADGKNRKNLTILELHAGNNCESVDRFVQELTENNLKDAQSTVIRIGQWPPALNSTHLASNYIVEERPAPRYIDTIIDIDTVEDPQMTSFEKIFFIDRQLGEQARNQAKRAELEEFVKRKQEEERGKEPRDS